LRVVADLTRIQPVPAGFSPSITDLVHVARKAGKAGATASTIHYWRTQGLVSAPFRHGREWRYPLPALAEVDGIARWGRRQTIPEVLTFARYVEAGTVETAVALLACESVLDRFRDGAREAAELAAKGPEAVREEAARVARARGKNALLPRTVRVTAAEREAAHRYLYGEMLSMALDSDASLDGQQQFERLIGLRSGRGGESRDVSMFTVKPEDWRIEPERLAQAVRHATPDAADLARRIVELNFLWLPALMPLLINDDDAHLASFIDIARAAADQYRPELYAVIHASLLARRFNEMSLRAATCSGPGAAV
jgi:hypothetical protein